MVRRLLQSPRVATTTICLPEALPVHDLHSLFPAPLPCLTPQTPPTCGRHDALQLPPAQLAALALEQVLDHGPPCLRVG